MAGWGGALLILSAYVLVSAGKVEARSVPFQAMNLVGAAGFVVNGWWHGAIPSASLNIVWMAFAAFSLGRIWKRRSSTSAM